MYGQSTLNYDDVKLIALNEERSMQLQIGPLLFMDSFHFISTSLDALVNLLYKSGKDKFYYTSKYVGNDDLVFQKGIFPYRYFRSSKQFAETSLPPKSAFYNDLTEEHITDEDYSRAQRVWTSFNCTTLRHYHDMYLLMDVELLCDVFENFRQSMISDTGLDCLYFPSLPSMTLQIALKKTDARLDLITDGDMYLTIESGIRGGISGVSRRYARANNPLLPCHYDIGLPTSYLTYLDCNSLYATCQMEPLPVGDFQFLSQNDVDKFDLFAVDAYGEIGYILDVDLHYPQHLHDEHNDYPLAANHLLITKDMLSPILLDMLENTGTPFSPARKLCPNFYDKTHYVCHYRNLRFYVEHGLVITKIHRIISFRQSAFMQPFIRFCNEKRKTANSDFEANTYKLLANSLYGKMIENIRKRVNVRLVCDPKKLLRAASKTSFRRAEIINEDVVMVKTTRTKVLLNKPIIIGFTILEISKLIMAQFYYDVLKPRYGDKLRLCLTDTDSFICHIETRDLYSDMECDVERQCKGKGSV